MGRLHPVIRCLKSRVLGFDEECVSEGGIDDHPR